MRLSIEMKVPANSYGTPDLFDAREAIKNALEKLPTQSDIEAVVIPIRDVNDNKIGTITVEAS